MAHARQLQVSRLEPDFTEAFEFQLGHWDSGPSKGDELACRTQTGWLNTICIVFIHFLRGTTLGIYFNSW